jgi:hypothetical protein
MNASSVNLPKEKMDIQQMFELLLARIDACTKAMQAGQEKGNAKQAKEAASLTELRFKLKVDRQTV